MAIRGSNAMQMTDLTELPVKQMMEVTCDPVQTPISLDKGLYQHVHLFCLTFSANVGHYMVLYRVCISNVIHA